MPLRMKYAVLVYQGGIANVFKVDCLNLASYGREAKRLVQGDFRTCEAFAAGLGSAGVVVRTMACNQAGDIANAKWTDDLESVPFEDKFCPVNKNGYAKTIIDKADDRDWDDTRTQSGLPY